MREWVAEILVLMDFSRKEDSEKNPRGSALPEGDRGLRFLRRGYRYPIRGSSS